MSPPQLTVLHCEWLKSQGCVNKDSLREQHSVSSLFSENRDGKFCWWVFSCQHEHSPFLFAWEYEMSTGPTHTKTLQFSRMLAGPHVSLYLGKCCVLLLLLNQQLIHCKQFWFESHYCLVTLLMRQWLGNSSHCSHKTRSSCGRHKRAEEPHLQAGGLPQWGPLLPAFKFSRPLLLKLSQLLMLEPLQ